MSALVPAPDAHLRLSSLSVRGFRNIARVELDLTTRLTVVSGDNGQGKTSLLEAIYFLCTSRSFRTHRLAEIVRHGDDVAFVKGTFLTDRPSAVDPPLPSEQSAAIRGSRAVVRVGENAPPSLAAYATRSPVVVFHPDELALSTGPATIRRRLLDRVALYVDPASLDHKARYTRALRSRHDLLRRGLTPHPPELDAFEQLAADYGARLTAVRARATDRLAVHLASAFRTIAAPDLTLGVRYAPGGDADPAISARAYLDARPRDAHRPTAGHGPHRDDIELTLDGHPVRIVASQGQHRALTLALKAAEAACIAEACGQNPILLLDDVSSELDPDRTHALFAFLAGRRGQIFLTTTRPEIIVDGAHFTADRSDVRIVRGGLETAL